MIKNIELLAPAGNFESLIAGVENGADAVYFGGQEFNARRQANNFIGEKIKEAIDYAHVRGVKAYLTLNTLLTNKELKNLTDFLITVYSYGIDGVIVQDLGVAKFIKSVVPKMKLHASTQMTIHNLQGAIELEEMGFERVVLSRELGLDEIKHICENTSLEVEVFVHGALCVCYSGQCLMSSMIGGRSGNRGLCAQPCRLPYQIFDSKGQIKTKSLYALSPKDLCTVENIGQIIESGIKSLKIEGRMKRPEYVAVVTKIYRKYINNYLNTGKTDVSEEDIKELSQIFNRGFSEGYLFGKTGSTMMSFEKPNNRGIYLGDVYNYNKKKKEVSINLKTPLQVGDSIEFWGNNHHFGLAVGKIFKDGKTINYAQSGSLVSIPCQNALKKDVKVFKTSSVELLKKAKESYKLNKRKIEISGQISVKINQPIVFKICDKEQNCVQVTRKNIVQAAKTTPLTLERLKEQIEKLGDTPFKFNHIKINMDKDISVSISEINSIRREAIGKLTEIRAHKDIPKIDNTTAEKTSQVLLDKSLVTKDVCTKLSVSVSKISQVQNISGKVDRIYIPITEYLTNKEETLKIIKQQNFSEIFIALPRILRKNIYSLIKKSLQELIDEGIDGILTGSIGQNRLIENDIILASDFSYNVFNSLAVDFLTEQGIKCVTLSPELTINNIKNIINYTNCGIELIVYGRFPLMISEYCPIGSIFGGMNKTQKCSRICDTGYELIDRMKNRFPVITDKITCQSQMLNSKILFLEHDIEKVLTIKPDFIRLNFTVETNDDINNAISFHNDYINKGQKVLDKYKEYIDKMKKNLTKGHYFRGVE